MAIRLKCECGKVLMASDDQAGLEGQCPACDRVITIPEHESLDLAGILDGEESTQGTSGERPGEEATVRKEPEGVTGLDDLERGLEERVEDKPERWTSGRSSRVVMLASIIVVFLAAVFVFMFVLREKETANESIIIKKIQPSTESEEVGSPAVGARLEEEIVQPEEAQPVTPAASEDESVEEVSTEPTVTAETEAAPEEKKSEVVASIPAEATVVEEVPSAGAYTINLASFRKKDGAERYVAQLREKGIDAFDWEIDIPQKGRWHRVSVGNFGTRQEAENYASELRKMGLSDIFVTKVPETS